VIGLTLTPLADANQTQVKTLIIPTTRTLPITRTPPITRTQLTQTTGPSEVLVPVQTMTIATAAVNAIGPGLQLVHGRIPMPHVDANQDLAIAQTPLTTLTHRTALMLLTTQILPETRLLYLSVTYSQDSRQSTTILTIAILNYQEPCIRLTKP